MPIVTRFNHEGGIAPYNGVVAVTENSRVLTPEKVEKDERFEKASKECVEVATLLLPHQFESTFDDSARTLAHALLSSIST